ncbi:hypothetical protein SAMN04487977_104298 [Treponema bryantii]|uniref:Mu-like prophage I protein n=1 Tax=Treponema bryantii TaxID=163 RepID=A0A1H9G6K7_9SPIR|nr:hypothetical protein [Treponema bryantii]SEQ45729.1 hypothetical protein SAMN04487977_104298 [Treponema bryantii]
MKKIRTWQLCRTGTFGQDGAKITEQDLKEIAETFTPTRPITIGHDAAHGDNFPKFGDVLVIDGIYDDAKHRGEKVLVGQVVLHPELEKQFSDKDDGDGCYKGWSVTIPKRASDGKRYLHSLAICGATPPKIPGLEQLMTKSCYSDGDTVEVFDFSDAIDYQEEIPMTEEEKKKMADLETENKRLKEDAEKASASKKDEENKKEKFSDSKEYADMQKKIEDLEASRKEAVVKGVCDKFADIPAGLKDSVQKVAGVLASTTESFEFSDKDGNKSNKTALDLFSDLLSGLIAAPKKEEVISRQVNTDEFNDKKDDGKETDWGKVAAKL